MGTLQTTAERHVCQDVSRLNQILVHSGALCRLFLPFASAGFLFIRNMLQACAWYIEAYEVFFGGIPDRLPPLSITTFCCFAQRCAWAVLAIRRRL